MKKRGFTLIELVMIIVILGILAAVAIPRYFDLQTQATQAAEDGVVGGVRAGISTYFANEVAAGTAPASAWPAALDSAVAGACVVGNACFDDVLAQGGITDGTWTKGAGGTYTGPAGTTYTYNSATGSFQ